MYSPTTQTGYYVPTTPVATTPAGGWAQNINSVLTNALNLWAGVEQVKAMKSTSGGDQQQRQTDPELANGAGVTVDTTAADLQAAQALGKAESQRNMIIAAGAGALGVAVLLKLIK